MSRDMKRLFGCPVCGFRVTGSEDSCPRCGTVYGKGTLFECPFCGVHVAPSSPKCPSCRVSYEEFNTRASEAHSDESIDTLLTDIISFESEQVRQEDKRFSCPRCSWMLDGSEEKCPKCGVGFQDAVCYQCPICAAMVGADSSRCPDCGTLFGEPEVPAEGQAVPEADAEQTAPEAAAEPEPTAAETETERPPEPVQEQAVEPVQEEVVQPAPEEPAQAGPGPSPEPVMEPVAAEAEPATSEEPPAEVRTGPAEEAAPEEKPQADEAPKPKQRKLKTRKVKVKQ